MPVLAYGADSWADLNHRARSAYDTKNYTEYRQILRRMLELAPGHPTLVYNLAGAGALLGDRRAAASGILRFAAMGLAAAAEDDTDFASVRSDPEFAAAVGRMEENRRPVKSSDVAFRISDPALLAEDIAYDAETKSFYVSSIHRRKIIRIAPDGVVSDFIRAGQDGVWGMMALAVDAKRRVLWATTAALPQAEEYTSSDQGRSAALQYDLNTGRLLRRWDAPAGERHALGDMTLDASGAPVLSDSSGALYTVSSDSSRLVEIIPPGSLVSPQTPAVALDGRILVADYARGIASVDRKSRRVQWLRPARDVAATGVDGLYLRGRTLIALQNGTAPQRLVRLELDSGLRNIRRAEVLERNTPALNEPTHGVFVNEDFFYIGTSGWDQWQAGARKPGDARSGPVILRCKGISCGR